MAQCCLVKVGHVFGHRGVNTGCKGPWDIVTLFNSTLVPSHANQIRVLRVSSYHFRATSRMGLWDRSPVHMPQGLTTLMAKTHFPIPMFLQPLVPTAHVSEESASKASIRELRPAVRSPFSLLKAEESH